MSKRPFWKVRDMPEETIQAIKVYAKDNGYTIAGAITALVNFGTTQKVPSMVIKADIDIEEGDKFSLKNFVPDKTITGNVKRLKNNRDGTMSIEYEVENSKETKQ